MSDTKQKYVLGPNPHFNTPFSSPIIMYLVLIALTPLAAYGIYVHGLSALWTVLVGMASAVAGESLFRLLLKRDVRATDGSAAITGLLLALSLPPQVPLWMTALGTLFAVVVAKEFFGGLGANIFNPALVGRAFLVMSFPAELTHFDMPRLAVAGGTVAVSAATEAVSAATEAVSAATEAVSAASVAVSAATEAVSAATEVVSAATEVVSAATEVVSAASETVFVDALSTVTPLNFLKAGGNLKGLGEQFAYWSLARGDSYKDVLKTLFIGNHGGSIGESSILFILTGALFLLALRVIDWRAPLAMIVTGVLGSLILGYDALFTLFSGAFLFASFFMVTDYVTSPLTHIGRYIFGAGVATIILLIRKWGGYPEGVTYAILIMNALVPFLDRLLTRRFGIAPRGLIKTSGKQGGNL